MRIHKYVAKGTGKRLEGFRKNLNLSQKEFAEKLGIPPNYISRYESGLHLPSPSVIKKMKTIFGLDDHWLVTGVYVKDIESISGEPLVYKLDQLIKEKMGIETSARLLGAIFNPEGIPTTAKLLQEKFKISPQRANSFIVEALMTGLLVGLGEDRYIPNPFFPFALGIKDPHFLKNISQLENIYLENNKEKIAKIKGMLDMADPGFQKIFDSLFKHLFKKEKEKETH
jgi:transcriptional regulator with XRE-family HTH domain